LSYVKIVEFQRRGLVHIHAVIRADGVPPEDVEERPGVVLEPPAWVTPDLIGEAVRLAAGSVWVRVDGGSAGAWRLGWGEQVDVRNITHLTGARSPASVAAYIAKYATKSTEVTGRDTSGRAGTPQARHTARMAQAALDLSEVSELAGLMLGRWLKELAYRGHVSSKSRRYSTTLTALRQARAEHLAEQHRAGGQSGTVATGQDGDRDLIVESKWELVGFGYSPGQVLLAADIARDLETNRAAAREAGDGRSRVGGRDRQRRPDDARKRGVRVADGGGNHNS
jgi:hypothetical protein